MVNQEAGESKKTASSFIQNSQSNCCTDILSPAFTHTQLLSDFYLPLEPFQCVSKRFSSMCVDPLGLPPQLLC